MDANPFLVSELINAGLNRREARWLVEEFMAGSDHEAIAALRAAAERRLSGEPLQYVIGHWPFRTLDLDLDARVLIPRPETEELVGFALAELAIVNVAAPLIMDLGCGSGAIGLALLQELIDRGVHATLVAVDESSDAIAVAKQNAHKHQLLRVSFIESSWFTSIDQSLRLTSLCRIRRTSGRRSSQRSTRSWATSPWEHWSQKTPISPSDFRTWPP
jgi:release factor glutamine methyltransferase